MKTLPLLAGVCTLIALVSASRAGDKEKPPVVSVAKPIQEAVIEHAEFTGRINAKESADIYARVTGHIEKVAFKEGENVKAGDLLYEIDARPYEAQERASKARVAQAEASHANARTTYQQYKAMADKGTVSAADVANRKAQAEQAAATLELAKAEWSLAKLNLDYTRIRAPIAGQIGITLLTKGDLAMQDKSKLTTIVATDLLYVYFQMNEAALLRYRQHAKGAAIAIGLASDKGFPHAAKIDFFDNKVDDKTGVLLVRGVLPRPTSKEGTPLLLPGSFVRVRVPISGSSYQALLVSQSVIVTNESRKYVLVVDAGNKVVERQVELGYHVQDKGMVVITKGVSADDRIIIGGLQRVRPGMVVSPIEERMPRK